MTISKTKKIRKYVENSSLNIKAAEVCPMIELTYFKMGESSNLSCIGCT